LERKSHIIITVTSIEPQQESIKLGSSFYYNSEIEDIVDMPVSLFKTFLLDQTQEVLGKNKSGKYHFVSNEFEAGVYLEMIPAQFHLCIYGDNYDVYPMIELAKVMDWEISLVGNMQKLKKEKIQSVTNIYHKEFKERPLIDDRTAVIIMAHDFKTDSTNLMEVLKSTSPYIASLGPKKRYNKMLEAFKESGFELTAKDKERIHAPSGLEIGANTPEEIALSIFSEILSVFNGKKGGMLKHKSSPIHERN
jgi:xanthine dehydrogenase accessory factor